MGVEHYQVLGSILVFLFFSLLFTNKILLALGVFYSSIPLKNCYFVILGAQLEIWKLISILLIPYFIVILLDKRRLDITIGRILGCFLLLLLGIMVSYISAPILVGYHDMPSLGLDWLLMFSQLLQQLVYWVPVLLPLFFKESLSLDAVYRIYWFLALSILIVGFLALLQWIIFKLFGENIFPIIRDGNELQYLKLMQLDGGSTSFFRVSSLSREPKNLSLFIVFGISIFHEFKRCNISIINKAMDTVALSLLYITLYLTASTLGYLAIMIYHAYSIFNSGAIRHTFFRLCLLFFGILIVYFFDTTQMVMGRTLDRLVSIENIEDFDFATVNFFYNNPFFVWTGVGFGNLTLIADEYLLDVTNFAISTNWAPRMGVLYILAGSGMIGLVSYGLLLKTIRPPNSNNPIGFVTHRLGIFWSFFCVLRFDVVSFVALGLVLVTQSILRATENVDIVNG